MPKSGDFDTSYIQKLLNINLEVVGDYVGCRKHHHLKCLGCGAMFNATPIAKIRNAEKYNTVGCPSCVVNGKYDAIRIANIQKLYDRGIEVMSDWNGQTTLGKESIALMVTVRNVNCGHITTVNSKNLLNKNSSCTACGIEERTSTINKWSITNSEEWQKTADIWHRYRAKVMSLTRINYKKHKSTINPTGLPTGIAGTEGAHHLDHIVPIRYCFEQYIPVEVCADHTNLQMLHWMENVSSSDNLKDHIPTIFGLYINK